MLILPLLFMFVSGAFAETIPGEFFISGCSIYNREGSLERIFPGKHCFFAKNGELISIHNKGIRVFGFPDKKLLWERTLNGGARIVMSYNNERLLVMEPVRQLIKGQVEFTERLSILSIDGKVLHETFSKRMKLLPNKRGGIEQGRVLTFFEIPPQKPNSIFRTGEYIAGTGGGDFYILSPDLQTVRKRIVRVIEPINVLTDPQVNEEGKIFFLNKKPSDKAKVRWSAVYEEYDPALKKVTVQFPRETDYSFMIFAGGGVAPSGKDHVVITNPLGGSYLFSRSTLKLIDYVPETHFHSEGFYPINRVRLEPIGEVLKRWAF